MTASWDDSDQRVVVRSLLMSAGYPSLRAMMYFRASQLAWRRQRLRPLALYLKARSVRAAGIEVHPAATIGPGFAFVHGVGIVVGHEVVAGHDLVLYQGVTIGHGAREGSRQDGQPRIGDSVRIGAGAKVLGPIVIGDDVRIGANAVVLADVPSGRTVVGTWKGVD
jgi:serine O-acetyltransferase